MVGPPERWKSPNNPKYNHDNSNTNNHCSLNLGNHSGFSKKETSNATDQSSCKEIRLLEHFSIPN